MKISFIGGTWIKMGEEELGWRVIRGLASIMIIRTGSVSNDYELELFPRGGTFCPLRLRSCCASGVSLIPFKVFYIQVNSPIILVTQIRKLQKSEAVSNVVGAG